jgi:hypothetical protein
VKQEEPIEDLLVFLGLVRLFLQFLSVDLPLLFSSVRLLLFEGLGVSSLADLNHAIQICYFNLHRLAVALACGVSTHCSFLLLHVVLVNLSLEEFGVSLAPRNQRTSTQVLLEVFSIWVMLKEVFGTPMISRDLESLLSVLLFL